MKGIIPEALFPTVLGPQSRTEDDFPIFSRKGREIGKREIVPRKSATNRLGARVL